MQIYRIVFRFRIEKGLEVELVLDQRGYMSGTLSQKAGMRIAVHSPHLHPLVDEFGLDVEPGTASSIAIQLVKKIRFRLEKTNEGEGKNIPTMHTWAWGGERVPLPPS